MNSESTFKLNFNHPIKAIYPFLSNEEIKHIFTIIKEETEYNTGPIPRDIFENAVVNYIKQKQKHNK